MYALLTLVLVVAGATTVDESQHGDVKSIVAVQEAPTSKPPVEYIAFEDLNVFDPLPMYTHGMSDAIFALWAKAQNKMAYLKARQRANEWDARNPALDTYVQDNDYTSTSDLDQSEGATSTGAKVGASSTTRYNGRSVQRTFRDRNRWSGGPVVIINPYRGK